MKLTTIRNSMRKLLFIILLVFTISPLYGQWGNWNPFNIWGSTFNTTLSGSSSNKPSGVTYSAEASQYFNRMTVKPSADTLAMFAEFIDSLKLNGVWDLKDVYCILANNDTTNALLNLKGSSYTGISIGTPTFTPYKGFTFAVGKYVNTTFNPFLDSLTHVYRKYTSSMSYYCNTNNAVQTYIDMGGKDLNGYRIEMYTYANIVYGGMNSGDYLSVANTNSTGLYTLNLIGTTGTIYKNGTVAVTGALTVMKKPDIVIVLGAYNNNGSITNHSLRQYCIYSIGAGLTAQQHIDENSCVQRLKTKMGW